MLLEKKGKSIIVSLLLISLLVFSGVAVVFGAADGNGSSYPGGSFGSCSGKNCMWAGQSGMRISLVDSNGNRVSGTTHIDLWITGKLGSMKRYALYKDGGELIWDFDGAWYGNQIKQEFLANPAGLQYGDYFNLPTVYDMKDVLGHDFTSVYEKWDPAWVQKVADWIKDNTSNTDTRIMDAILRKLGFNEDNPSITASNLGYYLQYEPLVAHGRIGSIITNYIFIGSVSEYYKYDKEKAGSSSAWVSGGSTHIYIYRDKAPSNFTTGTGRDVSNLLSYRDGKIIGEGVAHIWLSDLITNTFSCDEAIGYINSNYTPGTEAYHNAVAKLRNGTFKYTDDSGVERVQVVGYNHYYLKKEVYTSLSGGLAACNDPEAESCQDAIDYINDHPEKYPKGSTAYHNAVAQVKNKTFTYLKEVRPGVTEFRVIDASENTNYDYLNRSVYESNGGIAACKNRGVCDYQGYNVDIDDCITGKTYFGDINEIDAWLTCEIAYTKDGVIYSSDNTGHQAVETTNGGVVGNSEYCEVFCYEDFETRFPTSVNGVKAGQTFKWGAVDGTFGSVRVTKKCSTQNYVEGQQGYRFDEWEDDYKSNEKKLIKYYMNKASYEEAMGDITTTTTSKYTGCEVCPDTCGTAPNTYACGCHFTCNRKYKGIASVTVENNSYNHSYIGTIKGESEALYYSTGYDYSTKAEAKTAAKGGLKAILQSYANEEYAKYTGQLLKEQTLLEKIKQCTNNLKYVYETAVRFTFSEPLNEAYGDPNTRKFSFDGDLDVIEEYNEDNVDTSNCTRKTVYSYECSGTGTSSTCTPTRKTVLDCSVVKWNITGTYTYRYPTNKFQWYTLKTNGTLVNEEKKGSEDEAYFYSIGFGLPTAFSLTNGSYELKVTVSDLGDKATTTGAQQYNVENGHFAPIANRVNTIDGDGYGFDYSCVYNVENEIFGYDCQYDENGNLTPDSPEYCDDKEDGDPDGSLVGIDITYRLVTLLSDGDTIDKAFPGMDGNGRLPGSNWNIGTTELLTILDADVYNTDQAMYEIMLDVNAIQQIRQDNEKYFDVGKDPYTSYIDYDGRQKVFCATGTDQQKYCASDFISRLYVGTGLNYRLLGTCLPTSNTEERAERILNNGCDGYYNYPNINWAR